jgi:hypothetical protein
MSEEEREPIEERPVPAPPNSPTARPFRMERAVPNRDLWEERRMPVPRPAPKDEEE